MASFAEPSPSTDISIPFSWDDDFEDATDGPHVKQKYKSKSSLLRKLVPNWFRRMMMVTLVSAVLLTPGLVDYFLNQMPNSTQDWVHNSTYAVGGYSPLFWSIFLSGTYMTFQICRILILALPVVVLAVSKLLFHQAPRSFDIHMGYINDLEQYISFMLFMAILSILTFSLFQNQIVAGSNWQAFGFNAICSMLVGSVLLFSEKLLVQVIAVRFHRTAYQDRIKAVNYTSDVVNKLDREAHRILKRKASILQAIEQYKLRSRKSHRTHDTILSPKKAPFWKQYTTKRPSAEAGKEAYSTHTIVEALLDPTGKKDDKRIHTRAQSLDVKAVVSILVRDPALEQHLEPARKTTSTATAFQDENEMTVRSLTSLFSQQSTGDSSHGAGSRKSSVNDSSPYWEQKRLGSHKFLSLAREIGIRMDVHSPTVAKKIARRIFEAFAPSTSALFCAYESNPYNVNETIIFAATHFHSSETLPLKNFAFAFESAQDAEKAFSLFDKDCNGQISPLEMKDAVMSMYKDRKSLSASLRDVGSAVGTLDIVLTVGAAVLTLLMGLLIFGVAIGPLLVTSMSMIVAMAVIVGNSAKQMFEGIIFLFVTHPFDCGDRIFLDDQNLIVKEIGILYTVFMRWDGQLIYSPNSVLATKQIVNIRRSPNQLEVVELHVAFSTPLEKLQLLRQRLNEWLHAESREFIPRMELHPYEIENLNKIKVQLFLEHRYNWQDSDRRFARRAKFYMFLKELIEELGINYTNIIQPVEVTKV